MTTSHVWVRRGHTATLPCWLSPWQSAQDLEVQWFHKQDSFFSPVLYKYKKISSPPSYGGRVSFGFHGVGSGGLGSGDVSLELVNVTLQDSGEYTCYVSSYQSHDSATVTLAVTGECDENYKNHSGFISQPVVIYSVMLQPSLRPW